MLKATQPINALEIYGKLDQNLQRKKCSIVTFQINKGNE